MSDTDQSEKTLKILKYSLFCFIFGVFFVNSCMHTKMSHLEKEDLEWIKDADIYLKRKFISDSANSSSMLITSHALYNSTNPFCEGPWESGAYEAHGQYKFIITQGKYDIDGLVILNKSVDNDSLYFKIYMDNYHIEKAIPQQTATLNLNGETYTDCIIFDSEDGEYGIAKPTIPDNKISKFIMCKKYGLIYYQLESGEQFFRKSE